MKRWSRYRPSKREKHALKRAAREEDAWLSRGSRWGRLVWSEKEVLLNPRNARWRQPTVQTLRLPKESP